MFTPFLSHRLNYGIARLFGFLVIAAATAEFTSTPSRAQEPAGPVVSVTGGKVQGRFMAGAGGAVFKGIPYATQPIGDLRWRETQPVKPWKEVIQASEFHHGCGQPPSGNEDPTNSPEDCLYLNVWTPEWPTTQKKAVIFWINGGELFGGSGAMRSGVESLVRHGIVLVSANYRGTLLGMMGHRELTAESPHHSSGNYNLFDSVAGLQWVHDNIAKFGGDPGNVTVFGQSGGAHEISMLLASPLTKGLIQKAIIDSGAPMQALRPYLRLDELEQMGDVTAELLKAPGTGTIKYLRTVPAADFLAIMEDVRKRLLDMGGEAYDEGIDGYVIPRSPSEIWSAHQELAIPLMIGSTSQDTSASIKGGPTPDAETKPEDVITWQKQLLEIFYGKDPDLLDKALKAYGLKSGPNDISSYPPYGSPAFQLGVDINHRCGTIMSAGLHSEVAPTWLFEFTRSSPGQPPRHGSELRYVFGYEDLESADARAESERMQRYWTNFAKTGNPNGAGLPDWPKYDSAKKRSLEFANEGPLVRSAIRSLACEPYIEKYTRSPKLLSNGENLLLRVPGYKK